MALKTTAHKIPPKSTNSFRHVETCWSQCS